VEKRWAGSSTVGSPGGIDLSSEDDISDDEYAALTDPLEAQAGLGKFDRDNRIAAMLWVLNHTEQH
jgi:hypothetical protein